MLSAIDAYLLLRMQKFTDWIQQVFGIVKFDIHKWVVIFSSASYWMFSFAVFDPICFVFSLYLSFAALIKVKLLELDKQNWLAGQKAIRYSAFLKDVARQTVLVIQGVVLCFILFALLFSPSVAVFWVLAWCLLDVAESYLSACIPKPPGKSKTRELHEKLLTKLKNVLEPSPALAPVRR